MGKTPKAPHNSIGIPRKAMRAANETRGYPCYFCEPAWAAMRKELPITPRDIDVAQCQVMGEDARGTAALLKISRNTVRTHLKHIYLKLGVHTRGELMARLLITHDAWRHRAPAPPGCQR